MRKAPFEKTVSFNCEVWNKLVMILIISRGVDIVGRTIKSR